MSKNETQGAKMTAATYELCYSPTDGNVLIYRSVSAGIYGPVSETVPCENREAAVRFANEHGYRQAGEWEPGRNYDALPLVSQQQDAAAEYGRLASRA